MSTRITVRGEFRIEPPLKWVEIKDSPFFVNQPGPDDPDIVFKVATSNTETDDGVVTVITCDRVVPLTQSAYDPVNLAGCVSELCDDLKNHSIAGEMILYNRDDPGDIRRVVVGPDGVHEEQARILWPDGTAVELLY